MIQSKSQGLFEEDWPSSDVRWTERIGLCQRWWKKREKWSAHNGFRASTRLNLCHSLHVFQRLCPGDRARGEET